jgi:PAS domain S-box-containing protein
VVTLLFETYFKRAPAALFFCAIAVSSWFGGTVPGLFATLASGAVIYSPLLHPQELVSEEVLRLVIFLFSGGLIALMGGAQRRAEELLRQARDELELKVQERTAELQRANRELQTEIAERKNAEGALRSSEAQLKQAQAVAHLGSYEVDVLTGHTCWSDEVFRILGLNPASGSLSRQDFVERIVHPEDRRYAMQSFNEAIHAGKPYTLQYRVMRPDGCIRFVQSMGEPIRNPDGAVVRCAGAVLDITERKQSEDKLARLNTPPAKVRVRPWREPAPGCTDKESPRFGAMFSSKPADSGWHGSVTVSSTRRRRSVRSRKQDTTRGTYKASGLPGRTLKEVRVRRVLLSEPASQHGRRISKPIRVSPLGETRR